MQGRRVFDAYRTGLRGISRTSHSTLDSYATLGVPRGAGEADIKSAYRRLAKTHHPDLGGDSERFVRIQKAYENLMDPQSRASDAFESSKSRTTSANPGYWRSWNTEQSWWSAGNSSSSSRYSADNDFDTEFEDQWRRFSERNAKARGRRFRASATSDASTTSSDHEFTGKPKKDAYESTKDETDANGRNSGRHSRSRQAKKSAAPPDQVPDRINLKSVSTSSRSCPVSGTYDRASKFNGRVCFSNQPEKLFMFWSNKNKDWKISNALKDDGNCLAFNDRIHPSVDCPFVLGESSHWMIWDERSRRYLSKKLKAEPIIEDYSTWSVDKLRSTLISMGLRDKVDRCIEKSELIEQMILFESLKDAKSDKTETPTDSEIPLGQYRLCSRQRHDGVVQSPPLLSDKCKVGKNRVDSFLGPLEQVEDWLTKNGDRRRYYAVYDSERNFCFGLIWKNNKHWARAGLHEW